MAVYQEIEDISDQGVILDLIDSINKRLFEMAQEERSMRTKISSFEKALGCSSTSVIDLKKDLDRQLNESQRTREYLGKLKQKFQSLE